MQRERHLGVLSAVYAFPGEAIEDSNNDILLFASSERARTEPVPANASVRSTNYRQPCRTELSWTRSEAEADTRLRYISGTKTNQILSLIAPDEPWNAPP